MTSGEAIDDSEGSAIDVVDIKQWMGTSGDSGIAGHKEGFIVRFFKS